MTEETKAGADKIRHYRLPDPGEAVRIVVRRWWIVLLVTALGTGGAVAGSRVFRPLYQSYALIRLKAPSRAKVGATASEQEGETSMPEPTEVMRRLKIGMTSKSVLEAMIKQLGKDFAPKDLKRRNKLIQWLAHRIDVEHRQGNLYRIYARARSPELARKVTAHLTERALAVHRSGFEQQAIRLEAFAKKQVQEASAKLRQLEDQMVEFLEKHPVMRVRSLHSDQVLGVEGADRMRARSRASVVDRSLGKLAEKNPQLKELLARKRRLKNELRSLTESSTTGATTAFTQALAEAKNTLAELRGQGKNNNHPEVKQVLRRIKSLEQKIAATAPGERTSGSAYETKVRKELEQVEKKIRREVAKLTRRLPKKKEDRTALEAEWARFRRQHRQLSEQHSRLQEVAVNAALKKNLRMYEASKTAVIMEHPRAPEAPTGLSRPLIVVAGGVASLLLSIVLVLGLGILDTRLYRPEQVSLAGEGFELLAVLAHHPMKHLKQAARVRHQELLDGEGTEPGDEGSGAPGGEEDGSVIKWLRATDDLDSALSLLKKGEEPPWMEKAEEKWLDAAATQFYDRQGPRGLGQQGQPPPGSGAEEAQSTALVPSDGPPHPAPGGGAGPPQLKVRTLPSTAPLAPGLFVSTDPKSKPAEQMRLLAARLESQIGTALRVVAVSSWEPGIGKTTVAANLAMVLAESQKRVLAVDACPGRAALTRIFGIEPDGVGLCEQLQRWLDGSASPWEVVQIAETLTVLPASSDEQPALPLLSSEAFGRLVSDMSQIFDALVVDTEALQHASDAVVLQRRVDGYVMVASRKRSTTRSLEEISSRIDAKRILGVVFNEG